MGKRRGDKQEIKSSLKSEMHGREMNNFVQLEYMKSKYVKIIAPFIQGEQSR